jgi:hypothetical protein
MRVYFGIVLREVQQHFSKYQLMMSTISVETRSAPEVWKIIYNSKTWMNFKQIRNEITSLHWDGERRTDVLWFSNICPMGTLYISPVIFIPLKGCNCRDMYYQQYSTARTEESSEDSQPLRLDSKLKLCHLWLTSSIRTDKHKVGGQLLLPL